MAKKKTAAVASMRPDEMAQAGLLDDFEGTITKVRITAWDYDGNIEEHVLAVAVTIETEEHDEGVFVQYYSAGDLAYFVPSTDGESSCNLDSEDAVDWEGLFALQVGRREQISNSTNWAHFITSAVDAGFPIDDIGASCDFLEGVTAHFNRVPQKKRSGIITEDDDRVRDILLISEILETGTKKKGAKKKAAKGAKKKGGAESKAKAKATDVDSDLDDRIAAVVIEALAASDDNELPKAKLPGLMVKSFDDKADKAAAIKRVGSPEFLASRDEFEFDADEGTVSL